ncbi:hypothetical protein EC988_010400, partial [Linderina pennispora]
VCRPGRRLRHPRDGGRHRAGGQDRRAAPATQAVYAAAAQEGRGEVAAEPNGADSACGAVGDAGALLQEYSDAQLRGAESRGDGVGADVAAEHHGGAEEGQQPPIPVPQRRVAGGGQGRGPARIDHALGQDGAAGQAAGQAQGWRAPGADFLADGAHAGHSGGLHGDAR